MSESAGIESKMHRVAIQWLYTGAFGHAVEAIEVANNYKTANPTSSVSVILSKSMSSSITRYCPWIDNTFQVDVEDNWAPQIEQIPSSWDHIVYPNRWIHNPEAWYSPKLLDLNHNLQKHLQASRGTQSEDGNLISGRLLPVQKYSPMRMELPEATQAWARAQRPENRFPVISVLLNGSSPFSAFPSIATWRRLLTELGNEFPTAFFILTGVSQKSRFGFTTANFRNQAIKRLEGSVPNLRTCMDIGLEKQLAIIADSDIFLAPHTGFSFVAPALGTPWLAISGGSWGDCTVGDTPFYFSVPRCNRYPCYGNRKPLCKLKDRLHIPVPCVSGLLNSRHADIAHGIRKLLDNEFDLQASFAAYREIAIKQSVDTQKLWRISTYFSDTDNRAR